MCICLLQLSWSTALNIARYITLNKQIKELTALNDQAAKKNNELKQELLTYASSKGIEALARGKLKMVGKDEVLVLIKEKNIETDEY